MAKAELFATYPDGAEDRRLGKHRDHGYSLEPLGLPGLVFDPRAGLHIANSPPPERDTDTAVMRLTQDAAANVAAYGQPALSPPRRRPAPVRPPRTHTLRRGTRPRSRIRAVPL
ncbi:hypothetical protein [Streptomyces sp. NBC_00829]|uniref:hypothetical protein n=1 Tax=Streptomyces sp. NBC_00829 TaxID=2903679 RepID=UPI003869EC00|nr:hypothetical protein OG293_38060 [Streptomyces sp. NBC_00829]